jgi:hypothetical protein
MLDIFSKIKDSFGGGIAPTRGIESGSIPYRGGFKVTDGDAAYDTAAEVYALITAAAHTAFLKIWEKTIPAQQLIHWGYGSPALPYNQGFMWFASLDKTTDWDQGVLRLCQSNSRETKTFVVAEFPDSALHTATLTTLATAQPVLQAGTATPLPEKTEFPWVGQDSKMQLTYRLNVAATAHDECGFDIPISVRQ